MLYRNYLPIPRSLWVDPLYHFFFPLCFFNQVPQPGTLKLSHVQEGRYIFQLTVTDTAGQQSSDNVSVTVLPMVHFAVGETMTRAITWVTPGVWFSEQGSEILFSISSVLFCPYSLHNDISFSFDLLFQTDKARKSSMFVRAIILSSI